MRVWFRAHRRLLWAGCAVAAVVTLVYFGAAVASGETPSVASAVLQPIIVLWSAAAIVGLFLLGQRYARTPRDSGLRRFFAYGSDRSFAVFLVHPAFIWLVQRYGHWWLTNVSPLPRTLGVYVVVVAGSVLVAEIIRRSPLSLVLAGRPMIRPRRARTPAAVA